MVEVDYDIIVIGGGHAGAEAAWAASNVLRARGGGGRVAMVTPDASKIGQMSCNPAIGGLAKGQMVREIDALGGLMGLAIDAAGIQFRLLNRSKGAAVRGPRAQADKYAYAREVQRLLRTRPNLHIVQAMVDDLLVEDGRCTGVTLGAPASADPAGPSHVGATGPVQPDTLRARAVVLTTGTFMRGLMHTGESRTPGGRVDEPAAEGISAALKRLGFQLGRLKTGTPPRLRADSIEFDRLPEQLGDDPPEPFSEITRHALADRLPDGEAPEGEAYRRVAERFPVLEQRVCWLTETNETIHERIRANLHRAPMYNGQILADVGPRYCPSIEDKVVKFKDKPSHHVFLEPESLESDEVYCNGISSSLPADVQEFIVRNLPGCEGAEILRFGYAVEYDMVWPHQIDVTTMAKAVEGLFLAGQINGTSGYEEAAGQGLLAGLNAARRLVGRPMVRLTRDQAYLGVMMDDLVTRPPREPYRMFTSRAEHRLLLRADNAPRRLTELGRQWGLVEDVRRRVHQQRDEALDALRGRLKGRHADGKPLWQWARRPEVDEAAVLDRLHGEALPTLARDRHVVASALSDAKYAGFIERHRRQHDKLLAMEHQDLPPGFDYASIKGIRREAGETLNHFQPATLGQASRLSGITPADLTVLAVALNLR